jgi:hypothetical protein
MQPVVGECSARLAVLLDKKSPCQEQAEDEEEVRDDPEDDEEDESQIDLLDGVSALWRGIAKAFGPHAAPHLHPLLPVSVAFGESICN